MGGIFELLCLLLTASVMGRTPTQKNGRWLFGGTVTKVVLDKQIITEMTPSSCVVLQPSLPPCRNLRQLNIEPTTPTKIVSSAVAALNEPTAVEDDLPVEGKTFGWFTSNSDDGNLVRVEGSEVVEHQHQPVHVRTPIKRVETSGGGNWWGYSTVTQTVVEAQTRKYYDPDQVITFSVTGCQPTRLPFDLPYCEEPSNRRRLNKIAILERVDRDVSSVDGIVDVSNTVAMVTG